MPRFSSRSPLSSILAVAGLACLGAAGCVSDTASTHLDATVSADGYALFHVKNDRQQQDAVDVALTNVEPGTTYALLYSSSPPTNVGWFALDPATPRCAGAVDARCEIPGYGYLVDLVTVPDGAASATLGHSICGCDADDDTRDWDAYYAVMRVERGGAATPVSLDVVATRVTSFATEPDLEQLQ